MKCHRRTRPRNCYRSPVLQAVTFRQWLKRMGQQDLDAFYRDTMTETEMPKQPQDQVSTRVDNHKRPDVDENLQHRYHQAKRKCLSCGALFESQWSGNRLCESCTTRAA